MLDLLISDWRLRHLHLRPRLRRRHFLPRLAANFDFVWILFELENRLKTYHSSLEEIF